MHTADIDYTYDGVKLRGYLAVDEARASRVPGVLVVHDAGGLSENIREKARRVAGLGHCAFALDLFGDGKTVTDGMARIHALAPDLKRWRGLAIAGLQVLASRPECDPSRLAAIGYCFGGTTVYELARSGADLRGVVGFHSGLSPSSGEAKNIRGKVLTLIGADDPLIPPEARLAFEREISTRRRAMRAPGRRCRGSSRRYSRWGLADFARLPRPGVTGKRVVAFVSGRSRASFSGGAQDCERMDRGPRQCGAGSRGALKERGCQGLVGRSPPSRGSTAGGRPLLCADPRQITYGY